jgi:uncharacterized protein (DUF433 family)
MQYQNIITIEPGKRGGKPCIRGMRITVYDVLSYLASGMTYEEILNDFPYLTTLAIVFVLAYFVYKYLKLRKRLRFKKFDRFNR